MNMFPVGQNATSSNDGNTFGSAIRDLKETSNYWRVLICAI